MARFRVPSPSPSPPSSPDSGRSGSPGRTYRVPSPSPPPGSTVPFRPTFPLIRPSTLSLPDLRTFPPPRPPPGTIMPGDKPPDRKSCLKRHRADADPGDPAPATPPGERGLPEPGTRRPKKRLRWDDHLMLSISAKPDEPRPRLVSPPLRESFKRRRRGGGIDMAEMAEGTVPPSTFDTIRDLLDYPQILPPERSGDLDDEEIGQTLDWILSDEGTLFDLVVSRSTSRLYPTRVPIKMIPESFIWHTLISLLKATHYLQTGSRESSEETEYPSTWRPIVHNSINPSNIFYEYPQSARKTRCRLYGICKVGNFSRCSVLQFSTKPEDEDELETMARLIAFDDKLLDQTGYEAPELINDGDRDEIPGAASDLWSIGAVLVIMMTGRHVWDVILELSRDPAETKYGRFCWTPGRWEGFSYVERVEALKGLNIGSLAVALPSRYSEELRMLVEDLLEFYPHHRGDAVEYLREAEPRMP